MNAINFQDKIAGIREIQFKKQPEEKYDSDWICPYCGFIDFDAFELGDSDDKAECQMCGSIVSYEREVHFTYRVCPVKPQEVIEL
ncbi:MAG: hypothetical protein MJA84_04650 [Firmicutes bacterium]|nr:hypothetical protein [Bacillota bacterium]